MTASAQIVAALSRKEYGAARQAIESVLADDPRDGEMWFLLGIAQRGQGDPASAVDSYRRALATHAAFPDVWFNLGNALSDLPSAASKAEAMTAYAEAIRRAPQHRGALECLLALSRQLNQPAVAVVATGRLLELTPGDWPRRIDHLRALREAGQSGDSFKFFQAWLPEGLDQTGLLIEGGLILEARGDFRALAALYGRLETLLPGNATIKFLLGLNRLRIGQNTLALQVLREAEALGMTDRALWVNLGTALARLDRVEEALTYMQRAAPNFDTDPASYVFSFALKQKLCDWSGYGELRSTLLEPALASAARQLAAPAPLGVYPALPFPFTAFPGPISEAEQLQIARAFGRYTERGVTPYSAHPWAGSHARIRLGYLSADIHDHATAHLMLGLFKRHDRTRFEVFVYSYGPDDGTFYRDRVRADVEHFVDLMTLPDRDAAARIHADQIDVLVDLKGYTREARSSILAYRPAPVQVAWLGYPGSLGADYIDYALVDADVVPPEQAPYYSEKLLYMPGSYQVNDDEQAAADEVPTRAAAGLPAKGFVFCSFSAHFKIDPLAFDLWMRVLRAVPDSVLWLIDGYPAAREAMRTRAEAAGVSGKRLIFAPRVKKPEHLARHALADLFLDSFAYNAHTTMSDALWAGLPAISFAGSTFATRVGAGLLRAAGFPELVATTHDAYFELAVGLARDKARLASLRQRLRRNRLASSLFDTKAFAHDWEARLLDIVAPNSRRQQENARHVAQLQAAMTALEKEDIAGAVNQTETLLDGGCERPDAWNAYAVALRRDRQFALARLAYTRGLRLMPNYSDLMGNLGNLLREEDRLDEGLVYFQRAVQFCNAANRRTVLSNLASALSANAQPAEQLAVLDTALREFPGDPDFRWDRALCLLMLGRVREGLLDYESRFDRKNPPPRAYPAPQWMGGELTGQTLFLHWEQGYGDSIQFLRFLPLLVARGAKLVMEVQPGLGPLVASIPGVTEVVQAGIDSHLPSHDCWSSLMSVPLRLGIDEAALPVAEAYLTADPARRALWRERLDAALPLLANPASPKRGKKTAAPARRPRIGLIWAGNPNVKNDRLRSPRLAPLLPLFDLPGIDWVLLQQGDGRRDLVGRNLPGRVCDVATEIRDFADTAAVMAELDLVVSTDTSTAHLAAALGVPTWVLLHYASDWRWGLGERSLWYPSARLFRQHALADWSAVVAGVSAALVESFDLPVPRGRAKSGVASRSIASGPVQLQKSAQVAALGAPDADNARLVEAAFGMYQRGRWHLARWVIRQALTVNPDRQDAWCLLGVVAKNLGDYAEAERAYRQALEIVPDYADCWLNLGNLFRHRKDWAQAKPVYEALLRLQPKHAVALNLLSDVVRELGELDRAETLAREAIALKPDYPDAWGHLGNALNDLERFDEAAVAYDTALSLPGGPPDNLYNKGVALQRARKVEQALDCYRRILAEKPGEIPAHYNLATSLLTIGEFGEGLAEYEWRLKKPDLLPRPYPQPVWMGEPLAGRTLLLYWEQGCGDTLQFLRFIPLIQKQGGRIVLEVQHGLKEIAATVEGVDQVIEIVNGEPAALAFDCHAAILSVAARLGIGRSGHPALPVGAYLKAPPATDPALRLPPAKGGRKRVGLVWAGNPEVKNDRVRSPRLFPLAPLFDLANIDWVILQKGDGRRDLEQLAMPENTLDPAVAVKSFADTAVVMTQLDLMISSDTSTAHLAPALGVPTWPLLHYAADWRWMSGETTAWYPESRLFRQESPGDWAGAVHRLRQALEEWSRS